jgi:branched-chain amino acid transport system ATP-binding protein
MTTLLRVRHLEVRYGDLIGLADVSLEVAAGSVVALLGSNGAGKTTTLNAIAGLVRAHAGSIEWRGEAIENQPAYAVVAHGLTLSPEGWRLFTAQTVEQNLRLGATPLADKARVSPLLERVYALFPRLAERRRQRAGTLSGGERQMLAVGRALMSEPKLLMLDEPSLGLAPAVVETLYDTLARLHREGLTLLLAEQSVPLALEIADYAYVLQTGRTVLEGAAKKLEGDPEVQRIYLGISGNHQQPPGQEATAGPNSRA